MKNIGYSLSSLYKSIRRNRIPIVNGWLTAGMIYLLPLISVPSLDSSLSFKGRSV